MHGAGSICRKTNGGAAGAAINLGADAATLKVEGKTKIYHASEAECWGALFLCISTISIYLSLNQCLIPGKHISTVYQHLG